MGTRMLPYLPANPYKFNGLAGLVLPPARTLAEA